MIYLNIGNINFYLTNKWNDYVSNSWYEIKYGINTWGEFDIQTWKDIYIKYSQTDQPYYIMANSLNINDIVNDQSTCDFKIFDQESELYNYLQKGLPISIYDDNFDIMFSGFIDSVEKVHSNISGNVAMEYTIMGIDNHYLVNKRKMIKAFIDERVDLAVQWIAENILEDEGITIGLISSTTKTISKSYNYVNTKDVLDELSEYAACVWFIDCNKKLYFIDIETYRTPFDIVLDENCVCEYVKFDSFKVSDENPEYRNQQYLTGSTNKSVLQTKTFKGDGETASWGVGLPIIEQPTIYVNDVEKTIGLNQSKQTYEFYWTENDNTISQDSSGTKLTSSDVLKVEYYGSYPIVVKSFNASEIIRLSNLDGSSGIVEDISTDSNYNTETDALERTNVLISTYGVESKTITYTTRTAGIEAGQLQLIQSTKYDLSDYCLITQVNKIESEYEMEYAITAIKGPVSDYWTKQMLKISEAKARSLQNEISTSSVLLILFTFEKEWADPSIDDGSLNIFKTIYPGINTFPNANNLVCFDIDDKCLYMQIDTATPYRIYMTGQVITEDYIIAGQVIIKGSVVTTFIVPSDECNGYFTTVKFFGGGSATSEIDSGVLISSHELVYTKNYLESFQVVVTYTKES